LAAFAYRMGGMVTAFVGLIVYLVTKAESAPLLEKVEHTAEGDESPVDPPSKASW